MKQYMLTMLICMLAGFAVLNAAAVDRGIKVREVLGDDTPVPDYHALIVGVNDYQYWQDLRQAREDAQELARLLRANYGFDDVMTLYDKQASLTGMVNALRHLTRTLTPNDSLLIYYAGHGYYDPMLKKGYWVPSEARERIGSEPATTEWLHNTALKEYVDAMKARHVLVVSDSCFSGSMMRGGRVDLNAKEYTWYRRALSQPTRWCVASGDLETVPDQSVFARKFLQALQYPRQAVFSASDLAGWIKNEVAAHTGRHPVFGPMNSVRGSDIGEFVFLVDDSPRPAPRAPERQVQVPSFTAPRVQSVAPAEQTAAPTTAYGKLVVESPYNAVVQIDGGKAFQVSAGKALRWDRIPAGSHAVTVTSGSSTWTGAARIYEGRTITLKAFPGEARKQREADAARARAAAEAARRAEEDRKRILEQQASDLLRAVEAAREEEEEKKKKYRPRAH